MIYEVPELNTDYVLESYYSIWRGKVNPDNHFGLGESCETSLR